MDIKSFRAKSMQDALELVRRELGPEAALLHTREVPRRGLLGLLGHTEYELAAARNANLKSRFDTEIQLPDPELDPVSDTPTAEASMSEPARSAGELPPDAGLDLETIPFPGHLGVGRHANYSGGLASIYNRLLAAEVPATLAEQLCESIRSAHPEESQHDEATLSAWLRDDLARSLVIGHGLDDSQAYPRVVAAIGPTGVGKTTTIAKLAARARFEHRRRVGLVTVDTYRIAAVDQLQTYAEIMDLPMKIVTTPTEIRGALAELADCQQIFIDTAGRSPRDEVQVQQLRSLLKAASPDETYLVLSATSSSKSLADTVEKFAPVAPTSWVLTKIDEVGTLGNALSFLQDHRLPLAYVTNGQEVPHAIAAADAEDLVGRIL